MKEIPVRKGLTKDKILEESRVLLNSGGPAALTMRALGARLGVAAMAIYNHFQDRDAILDALADSVFEQLREAAVQSGAHTKSTGWRKKLKTILVSAQQLADHHPQVFRVAFTRPNKPASAFALASDSIRLLQEEAGLNSHQALVAYHAFVILLQGYPFWHQGIEQHGLAETLCPPPAIPSQGLNPQKHFESIIDWLLDSIAAIPRKRRTT